MDDTLRNLVERDAISRLGIKYALALDAQDWVGLGECFTPDATLVTTIPTSTLVGRASIVAGMAEMSGSFASVQHLVANSAYDVNGAEARGTLQFVVTQVHDATVDSRIRTFGGQYRDTVIKAAQGWLFAARVIELLWGPIDR